MRLIPMITTYQFGILPPTTNATLVRDQIKRGHAYQNKLIEIEIWRRGELRKLLSQAGNVPQLESELRAAEETLDTIEKKRKSANAKLGYGLVKESKTPKKAEVSAEDKLAKKEAQTAKKVAKIALTEERKRVQTTQSDERKKIEEEFNKRVSEITRSDDAPWSGTYTLIRAAFGIPSAKGKTKGMPLYDGTEPKDPRFRRFDGSGRLGIGQFQPNEPLSKVIGNNPTSTQIRILPMPPAPLRKDGSPRKVGKKDLRLFQLRIGTEKGKIAPIWADFPLFYDRSIPPNSLIKTVQVCCNKIAQRERWTLSITFDDQRPAITNSDTSSVGIDLGWRALPEGLRVAKWEGSDGQKGEIVLPQRVLDRLAKAEEIKSGRDRDFDRFKALLSSWVAGSVVPDWLTDEVKTLGEWRSQGRAVALLRRWKDKRFSGDEEIWEWLEYWRYHDFHLYQCERSLDTKARGWRNEIYRIAAAKLAEQYGTLVFEDIRLDIMAKGKIAGDNRFLAAPSEFRNACKNAARTRGKDHVEVPAAYTTKRHLHKNDGSECGFITEMGGKMEYVCDGCGEHLDRDENAAHGILHRWLNREQSSDTQSTGSARSSENTSEIIEVDETQQQDKNRASPKIAEGAGTVRKQEDNAA
jgi:Putative transposase DNA-binding domain